MNRSWTQEEEEHLRRTYGQVPVESLASLLERTPLAIQRRASMLGVAQSSRVVTPEIEAVIRNCVSRRLTDGVIARRVKLPKNTVKAARRRMGLPACPRTSPSYQSQIKRVLMVNSAPSLSHLRSQVRRATAARLGWPIDLPYPCILVLEVLRKAEGRLLTRRDLAASLGRECSRTRCLLRTREGKSYVAILIERGLIVRERIPHPGPCRWVYAYTLAPGVRPGRELAISGLDRMEEEVS